MTDSTVSDATVVGMEQRLQRMLARSRQAKKERERLQELEKQIRFLAEKLGVELT